ncbi:gastrula zinc finger protein XlCGF46.1 [Culex quinquefasciatus]|uniref:gastrula zinc finger protein XlCGF46.1 n=1 Tax=Culex quinquefasciatus TaxID=7176 RepID=UPI0018E325AB|nr:gastrula zinc finger protein XlCGF46.1 [Culex quinquefasciatus]
MKVCRVCLAQDQEQQQFESVFAVREEQTIANTIMLCTGVEINCQDGLTQLVCELCVEEFLKFNKLRQKCLEADAFLRQKLKTEHVAPTIAPETNDVTCPSSEDEEYKIELLDVDLEDEFGKPPPEEIPDEGQHDWVVISEVEVVKGEVEEVEDRVQRPRKRRKVFGVDRRQPEGKFFCCSCPAEEFDGARALEMHRDAEHLKYRIADNVIRPFECDVCFQRFLTERHLDQHKTRPYKKREYVCTSCGNAFLASNTLKKHEEICVTTERNYACDECGKRFTQVGSLRNHQKLHTTAKAYSCPICAKTFLKKFEVPIHMVTHTEEQPFPCDQCPARFKRKQALRNHQRHHANPTPFKCDLCDQWFNNFSARKFHRQKVHEGLDPFRCYQCGASFGRKNRLEQHVKRAHAVAS